MNITIRHVINLYLYSSLHIGLCCVLLYLFTLDRFGIETDYPYLIFILSSTIFTYSIHRIIGMNKVRKFVHQGRFAVISKYRTHIIIYAIIGGMTSAFTYCSFSFSRMILLLLAGTVSILYTLPIFGKSMRLRDFSFIKIFLIAIVWSVVTESIPLYESSIDPYIIAILFLERVCFFIAITIPFDIRDIEVDLTNNVKTIPSVLGIENSIKLAILLLICSISIEVYFMLFGSILGTELTILAYLITIVIILKTKKQTDDYYFSGLLDGTIMLPFIFIELFN